MGLLKLEELPGAWIVAEGRLRIVSAANTEGAEVLGGTVAEVTGRRMADFKPTSSGGAWPPRHLDSLPVERQGKYEDVWIARLDGTFLTAEVHISSFQGRDHQWKSIILISDTSVKCQLQAEVLSKHQDLRRAHAELKAHAEKVERAQCMLQKLNHDLATTSAKLNRTSQLAVIGELTAELAHQINNPLAAAISAQRFLEEIVDGQADEDLLEVVDILKLSLGRISETIEELKRVYRNIENDSAIESLDLKSQVDSALLMLRHKLEEKSISVERDIPEELPTVSGRAANIQHVIINLIDNAINAVDTNGRIGIEARSLATGSRLAIEDDGPGVPSSLREKVLEPFYTTRDQGTGLGLSIVKRYLFSEGARLSIGDSKLGGARFVIDFCGGTPIQGSDVWYYPESERL